MLPYLHMENELQDCEHLREGADIVGPGDVDLDVMPRSTKALLSQDQSRQNTVGLQLIKSHVTSHKYMH